MLYNNLSGYFREKYGKRLKKICIDGGFSCPNRDGKVGRGGCTFCNNQTFNPAYCHRNRSVTEQMCEGIAFLRINIPR